MPPLIVFGIFFRFRISFFGQNNVRKKKKKSNPLTLARFHKCKNVVSPSKACKTSSIKSGALKPKGQKLTSTINDIQLLILASEKFKCCNALIEGEQSLSFPFLSFDPPKISEYQRFSDVFRVVKREH